MILSAIIITKNAENLIADCLETVKFCNEILVVDNGSIDRTAEIAGKFGAKVIPVRTDSFAVSRNIGFKKAKGDWFLYVDADEKVTAELKKEIIHIIKTQENSYTVYKIPRKNIYFEQYEWPTYDYLERLFRRGSLIEWYGTLHESPKIKGKIGTCTSYLLHYSHTDLSTMLEKTIQWSKIEAQLRYDSNHPKITWWRFPRVMITAFFDSFVKQKGYKMKTAGLIESIYQTFSIFITYARLWEMQKKNK